jgi:hypothetical protein
VDLAIIFAKGLVTANSSEFGRWVAVILLGGVLFGLHLVALFPKPYKKLYRTVP